MRSESGCDSSSYGFGHTAYTWPLGPATLLNTRVK